MRPNVRKSIFFSFGTFIFFGVQQLTDWFIVTFSGIRGLPYFIDLRAVLKSSDCQGVYGWDIYDPSIAQNCSYIYGSNLIRLLHLLNLDEKSTYLAGWILLGLFSFFIGVTLSALRLKNSKDWFVALLVLFSPPTMLLLERANVDILIVLLIAIFSYAISANRNSLAYAALFLASVSKFYTAPVFAWLALTEKSITKKLISISLLTLSFIIIVLDLSRINGNFPRNSWASFGNPIFGIYFRKLGYEIPHRLQDLLGVFLLLLTFTAMKIASRIKMISLPEFQIDFKSKDYVVVLAQTSTLVFLFCYFASVSYDYRLVFLFIPAIYMLNSSYFEYKTKTLLSVSLVLSAWLTYSSSYLQILGDLVILPWIVVLTRSALLSLFSLLRDLKLTRNA